jgi:two-component system, response regulator PdtaR
MLIETKSKILLCEDDLITAMSIKQFLERNDFYVYEPVTSGRKLIEEAIHYFPSLIISDIVLKGDIDGIEAISRISQLVKIPYIFITGFSDYTSLIDMYFLKPLKIFLKPINLEKLCTTIDESIGHLQKEIPYQYHLG